MKSTHTEIEQLLGLAEKDADISREQAVGLLNIENGSEEFYRLLHTANAMSRKAYGNKGYVFAQIGINAEPCSKNCKFCSMGAEHYALKERWRKSGREIAEELETLLEDGISDFFLMTTADYPLSDFIKLSTGIKKKFSDNVRYVANIGDFNDDTALKLREAGFTGAYHINRLREGTDTSIDPKTRLNTLEAVKKAGLELYYCVEPIGPEHSYEEIADEMFRAKEYNVQAMAVMRRIPVPGTPLFGMGKISAMELAKIAAVTRIATKPARSMNAHEPAQMTLLAGVNQLYAEAGANPRDPEANTEKNRGLSVKAAWDMLWEAGYGKA